MQLCFFVFIFYVFSFSSQQPQIDADSNAMVGTSTPIVCGLSRNCTQAWVTTATQLTQVSLWLSGSNTNGLVTIRDSPNGLILATSLPLIVNSGSVTNFTFAISATVTPNQLYWIQLECAPSDCSWYTIDTPSGFGVYPDGFGWQNGSDLAPPRDFRFQTQGFLVNTLAGCNPTYSQNPGNNNCVNDGARMLFFQPTRDIQMCSIDITSTFLTFNANGPVTLVFYESTANDINSNFNQITSLTRPSTSGSIVLRNITNGITRTLRSNRFYFVGFAAQNGTFKPATCGGTYGNPDFTAFSLYQTPQQYNGWGASWTLASAPAFSSASTAAVNLKIWASPISTTGALTTAAVTSSPLTTSPVTSSPLTSSPLTTSPVTSSPLTTSPVTSSPLTSSDLTTNEVTSVSLTTGEITSASPTSGVVPVATTGASSTTGNEAASTSGDSQSADRSGNQVPVIAGAVAGSIAVTAAIAIVIGIILMKRKQKKPENLPEEGNDNIDMKPQTPKPRDVSQIDSRIPILTNIEIKKQLGAGSFGDVFLGTWNGTKVALKKLKNQDAFDEFVKEAGTLSQVIHPNCVQFLGIYKDPESKDQYIVVEYLPQGALRSLLKEKSEKLNMVDLLNMMIGAAKGLAYLESKSILHRDIALRNLLAAKVDGKYTAKVSDFGLSRTTDSGEYQAKAETKLPVKWTAPEVFRGGAATVKNDVWAFGVTMWEIASLGSEPYVWLSNKEVVIQVPKGERLNKPENCPQELYELMQKCWDVKPENRPSFVEIVNSLKQIRKNVLVEHPEFKKEKVKGQKYDKNTSGGESGSNTTSGNNYNNGATAKPTGYTSIPAYENKGNYTGGSAVENSQPIPESQNGNYEKSPMNKEQ